MATAPKSRTIERLTLILCVLASLVLLGLPSAQKTWTAGHLSRLLTAPWTRVLSWFDEVASLRSDNDDLRARVAALEIDGAAAERLRRERDDLRAALGLVRREASRLVPCELEQLRVEPATTLARVRAAEPVPWREHQPVITAEGLVGRVLRADGDRAAWVELVSSPEFAICCEIERTGLPGILRPGAGTFTLTLVGRDEDVRPGDRLVTSDIPAVGTGDAEIATAMPRGIPVGVVRTVDTPLREIFKSVVVELQADLGALDVVFVVVGDGDWLESPDPAADPVPEVGP